MAREGKNDKPADSHARRVGKLEAWSRVCAGEKSGGREADKERGRRTIDEHLHQISGVTNCTEMGRA